MTSVDQRRTPLDHWGWTVGPQGLAIEGQSIAALASSVPTPFYVLVESRVGDNAAAVHSALGAGDMAFYALKANGFDPVVRAIARSKLGAEVISARELDVALNSGFQPERIIFNGPGKSDDDLALSIRYGCLLQVESASEARSLVRLARSMDTPVRAGVRLNPDIVDESARPGVRMGAKDSIFGLDPDGEEFREVVAAFDSPWVDWQTVSAHIGTGIRSAEPFVRLAQTLNAVRARLRGAGVRVRGLDLGGGFAVPSEVRMAEGDDVPPFEATAAFDAIVRAVRGAVADDPPERLMFEPGRLLVSDTMHLISRVVRKKRTAHATYLILDASAHQNAQFVRRGFHELANVGKPTAAADEVFTLAGPLCADFDVFQRDRRLPATDEGDLIAIFDVGAYNYSAQSSWSFPPAPGVVLTPGAEPAVWPAFDRAPRRPA